MIHKLCLHYHTFFAEAYLIKKRISEGIVDVVVVWETSSNLKGNCWGLKLQMNETGLVLQVTT